ncbi:Galactose oxidase/kelch beta-propeller [Penicillium concentricum]|uniref:Galactose oxidase/kelch beta-propeller n=1 Tax=Penicillium concentricum TaxID=293559 RepID=A0A9W9SPU4_9EURO|nr:Galactose oxidase/kelch beta-propeller [Penicillium concentricum]KAJ5382277.1 Galactose oxidase/kelch beta-propeller [Penicillium concentricum]
MPETQSLWVAAKAKLDKADQQLLEFDSDNGIKQSRQNENILESLEQTTQEAYDTCVHKRWKITIPGKGKKFIIRDLLSKVAHWIDLFKSVGDQIVQYDPGHAALPWAGARFLLQMAINDFSKFDFVVQGAERITKMTARYKIIEQIYVQKGSAASEQLEQAVVGVYGSILKYLVGAKRYFEHKTGGELTLPGSIVTGQSSQPLVRILKSGLFGQNDFQELLDKMEADERLVDRCASLVQGEMNNEISSHLATLSLDMSTIHSLQDTLSRMKQPISQAFFPLSKVEDHLDSIQRRQMLDWLSSQPYVDHHATIKFRVLDGTCQWVLQHASFTEWKAESTNSLLWLHGAQGAGKSCLASMVVEDGMNVSSQIEDFAHAYFYCSRNTAEPQRANAQSILGCIARQLSSPSSNQPLAPPTLSLYRKLHLADGSTRVPSLYQCRDLIIELSEAHSRTTIVVDALDECSREERAELVEALEYIIDNSTSLVKIFVTSREEGDLRLSIQAHSGVQVTWVENGSDIEKFVNFETDRLVAKNQLLPYIRFKATKENLKALIKEDTISKANGMFRWAQLQLQSLRWIRTERDIRLAMLRIPRPLSELYEDLYSKALESTEDTDRALFRNTLKWMLCTTRVFGWEDFSQALTSFVKIEAYEIDEDFILDLLSNFVISQTTQEGKRTFRFAHLSVREFLENKSEYSSKSSNTFAAEVCLLRLLGASGSPSAEQFLGRLDLNVQDTVTFSEIDSYKNGIHDYSLRNWNEHCVGAGEMNRANEELYISRLLRYFLFDDSDPSCPLKCWIRSRRRRKLENDRGAQFLRLLQNYPRSRDLGFVLSCVFGFGEVLRLDHYHELDDNVKEACILAATTYHKYDILEYLIGETTERLLKKRVLEALVRNNAIEPLKWFLGLIEPDLITGSVIVHTYGADQETIELLLDHNKNLHITTELIEECEYSYTAIDGLLRRAPDLLITPEILNSAIADMPIERLRETLDKNDRSIITSDVIGTASSCAGYKDGMRAKIELLLERAGQTKGTERAMMRAIVDNGNTEVIQILLDHGWPVTEKVMVHAAKEGMVVSFQLLLKAGGLITSQVIVGGAQNAYDGARMVMLLVSLMNRPLDDELWVQMMLQCAQIPFPHSEILQALLEMKPDLMISEEVLIAFMKNPYKGNSNLGVILEDNREIQITDAVIVAALKSLDYDKPMLKLLDRHGSTTVSSQMLLGAAQNIQFGDEMTKLLLQRTATIEKPSSMVVDAVVSNLISGYATLQILESYFGQLDLCEAHVKPAAESGNHSMLSLVLDRCSITEATPPVLLATAAKGSLEMMKHLLRLDNAVVTEEILIAASGNYDCSVDMLKMLWNFAPHIGVCPKMFLNVQDSSLYSSATIVGFLFSRVKDSRLCQDILDAVMTANHIPDRWDDLTSVSILNCVLESEFEIEVTDKLVVNALNAGHGWLLRSFFTHRTNLEVSQDMVNTAVELEDYRALQVLVRHANSPGLDLQDARFILDNSTPPPWRFFDE